jgi:predicted cobalt transporter CbtA
MRICCCKAIYLFDVSYVTLSKILEMIGFALVGGTIYSFVGMTESELRWPVFWSCAGGAMAIIIYRNYIKKRKKNA